MAFRVSRQRLTGLFQAMRGENEFEDAIKTAYDFLNVYARARSLSSEDVKLTMDFVRYRFLIIRMWWKGRMQEGLGSHALEKWGREYDPWSRRISEEWFRRS
jgi:Ser/Thr protein kinase RdoA (MazF antagonist)